MGIKHSLVADSSKTITSSAWNADHVVDSTALISSLNADLLDNYHASGLGPTHGHSISQITINNNIVPQADNAYDLGSDSKRYRTIYLRNNLNIPIWKTGTSGSISQCGGIYWYGLTDSHRIFVEEYTGTGEYSRLVIQNADNGDTDYLLIRNYRGGQGIKNVMEFRRSYIGAGTELRPLSDNSIDLGNSSYKWRNVYANTIIASTLSGTIDWVQINNKPSTYPPSSHGHNISDVTINNHILPTTDLSYNIGSSSYQFSNLYLYNFVNFPIRRTDQAGSVAVCGGLSWVGLTDQFRIMVEEYSGTSSSTRLVLQSSDDKDLDYISIRSVDYQLGTKTIMDFRWSYISAATELRPVSDNSIDLGNNSYKWRTVYANTIVANTLSGTIDWSQINNKPSVTGYITPYAGDETEITVTSTSDTTIKNARVVRLSSLLGTFSTMIFVMEGRIESSGTLTLSVYLSGNLVASRTFTGTSYSLDNCQANVSGFGDGTYLVELKARVSSGATGYNRIFEVYLR